MGGTIINMKKPMKTVRELIQHMKNKGIGFNILNEVEAEEHLNNHNNYFKLTAYRKNYTKYTSGSNKDKYERLEFAYLVELARIDAEIRSLLLDMALDIEHFLKVALIKVVENEMINKKVEDGYKILDGYFNADDIIDVADKFKIRTSRRNQFNNKFPQNIKNPYCSGLIKKYNEEIPIWAYIELCSFGDIKDLIAYYSCITGWNPGVDIITLDRIRQLRNACAHGNCIINDLTHNKSSTVAPKTPQFLAQFLINAGINQGSRHNKMSNPRINQIVHLLYTFDKIVVTDNTRNNRVREFKNLISGRLQEHKDYFKNNQLLSTTYDFFQKIANTIK